MPPAQEGKWPAPPPRCEVCRTQWTICDCELNQELASRDEEIERLQAFHRAVADAMRSLDATPGGAGDLIGFASRVSVALDACDGTPDHV